MKVGVSRQLSRRIRRVRAEVNQEVELLFATPLKADPYPIESAAHWFLGGKSDEGEWFWVTLHDAIAAITRAIKHVEGNKETHLKMQQDRHDEDMSRAWLSSFWVGAGPTRVRTVAG